MARAGSPCSPFGATIPTWPFWTARPALIRAGATPIWRSSRSASWLPSMAGFGSTACPCRGDPFAVLERELDRYRIEPARCRCPFAGGAVGFLGYELGRCLERLPARHANELAIPDMVVAFYDVVIAFDQSERRAWILSSGLPADATPPRCARAERRARAVFKRFAPAGRGRSGGAALTGRLDAGTRPGRVSSPDRDMLQHIRAGDIYQANFTAPSPDPAPAGTAADLYRALRRSSPAPFAAYLACGPRLAVASASPERFLRLDIEGRIETPADQGHAPARPRRDRRCPSSPPSWRPARRTVRKT